MLSLGTEALYRVDVVIPLIIGLLAVIWAVSRSKRHRLAGLPNAQDSIAVFEARKDRGLVELVQRYGKNFRMHLTGSAKGVAGASEVFATADPAIVRKVLMDRVHSVVRPPRYALARWIPYMDGVLFMDGPVWKAHTAALLPVLAPSNFEKFAKAMHLSTERRMAMVEESVRAANAAKGSAQPFFEVDMLPLAKVGWFCMACAPQCSFLLLSALCFCAHRFFFIVCQAIALDNLLTAGFGVDLKSPLVNELRSSMRDYVDVDNMREDAHPLVTVFKTIVNWFRIGARVKRNIRTLLAAGPETRISLGADGELFKPTADQLRRWQAPTAKTTGNEAMTAADLQSSDSAQPAKQTDGHVTFLDRMVAAGMSLDEITSETNHLNGAHKAFGVELTFSLFELARSPDIRNRLMSELDQVLSRNNRTVPTRADLAALPYCQAVFKEVLRRHCISMGIVRVIAEPLQVADVKGSKGPVTVPANTPVLLLMHAVHHLPEFWDDPETFNPDRWLKPNGKLRSQPKTKFSYFPFLEGPRQCQGRFFVVLEWLCVVNAMLRRYDISLPPNYVMAKKADFYPIPETPISIRFAPRA